MLNERENLFIQYWEVNRLKQKSIIYQLLTGLPIGILFSLPIVILLFTSQLWYKRADMVAKSQLNPFVLIVAVFLISVFVAVLYKRHQWDLKEQQYRELLKRQK